MYHIAGQNAPATTV